eukprot:5117570-Prymnesium_polylepis.1
MHASERPDCEAPMGGAVEGSTILFVQQADATLLWRHKRTHESSSMTRSTTSSDTRTVIMRTRLHHIHKLRTSNQLVVNLSTLSLHTLDNVSRALFFSIAQDELVSPMGLRSDLVRLCYAVQATACSDYRGDVPITTARCDDDHPASPATPETCEDEDEPKEDLGRLERTPSMHAGATVLVEFAGGAAASG